MSGALTLEAVPLPPTGIPVSDILDVPTFREHRPEFADVAMYPDGVVQLYIDTGSIMCTHYIWGRMRQMGVELFTAHMLSLQQYSIRAGGGIPGAGIGPVQSKSVSKVSVSYDTALGAIEGGGPWNLTIYGSQFLWFVNLVGTGGFEVLGFGYQSQLEGVVWTWQRGVQLRFGS